VDIERFRMTPFGAETVNVAVVLLPHMSNFTDFNQLAAESDVALRYVASPKEFHGADVMILPGSKTTIADLDYLRKAGFDAALTSHAHRGGEIVGICGGFQMLGANINDPYHVETGGMSKGLGFLDVETELVVSKKTMQVRARALGGTWDDDCLVEGYEIHMGVTVRSQGILPCFEIISQTETVPAPQRDLSSKDHPQGVREFQGLDGAKNADGMVWGTYIHGVFDQPGFRREWLNRARIRKTLPPLDVEVSGRVSARLTQALDRWADHVGTYINTKPIFTAIELPENNVS